jgi:hypothetical protein
LWQYRLEDDGQGRVRARKVRAFEAWSGGGEIEAIAVDDALGYVYYADEAVGIRKYRADPDAPGAEVELALFGGTGFARTARASRSTRSGMAPATSSCPISRPTGSSSSHARRRGATRTPIRTSRQWRWPRWRATDRR